MESREGKLRVPGPSEVDATGSICILTILLRVLDFAEEMEGEEGTEMLRRDDESEGEIRGAGRCS